MASITVKPARLSLSVQSQKMVSDKCRVQLVRVIASEEISIRKITFMNVIATGIFSFIFYLIFSLILL